MNENAGAIKKEIRKKILGQRKELETEFIREASAHICQSIQELDLYKKAEDICLYMPIRNEVELDVLREFSWADGKRTWLPKVRDEQMDFCLFGPQSSLREGAYGILEPEESEVLVPRDTTLVIMPGAVFSEARDRIGYGGGYYDRYLSEHVLCHTLAVCYELQIVEDLPTEEHDIRPDAVISERRILL